MKTTSYLVTFTLLLTSLFLTSCDNADRQQTQIEWQQEYDANVEASRSNTTPPPRNLLSFGQQDEAAEQGRELQKLDQEKGAETHSKY